MSLPLRPALENVASVDRVLEDLLVRFIINCPPEDLSSVERELFHFEEASWFYTDFIKLLNPSLPSLKIKSFAQHVIRLCPLVWKWDIRADEALQKFSKYKKSIPVRGAAIFNDRLSKILLVQGTESDSWSFPRGKISKDEDDVACCIREVREEIGFDLTEYIDEDQFIERNIQGKNYKIFIVRGVPEQFDFKPQVRNEIEKIEWRDFKKMSKTMHKSNVKYYLVNSMMRPLSIWLRSQRNIKNDDQLKQYAEEQLKLLLGITREEQTDPGRDLLNMLHTAVQSKDEKIEPLQTLQNEAAANTVPPVNTQPLPINSYPHQFPGVHPFAPFPYVNGSLPFVNPVIMGGPAMPNHNNGFTQMNLPGADVATPEPSSLAKPVLAQASSNSRQLLDLLNTKRSEPTRRLSRNSNETDDKNAVSDSQSLLNILRNPKQLPPQTHEEPTREQEESADDGYEEFESDSQDEVQAENDLEEQQEQQVKEVQRVEEPAAGSANHEALKENVFKTDEVPHVDERTESAKSMDGITNTAEKSKPPKPKFKLLRRGEKLDDILPDTRQVQSVSPISNNSPNPLLQLLQKPSPPQVQSDKKLTPEDEIMAMLQNHQKNDEPLNASAQILNMLKSPKPNNPTTQPEGGTWSGSPNVNGAAPFEQQSASADLLGLLKRPNGVQNSGNVADLSSRQPALDIPQVPDYAHPQQSSNDLLNLLHRNR